MPLIDLIKRGIVNAFANWQAPLLWFFSNFITGIVYVLVLIIAGGGVLYYVVDHPDAFDYNFTHDMSQEDSIILFAEIFMDHWMIPVLLLIILIVIFTVYASLICFIRGGIFTTLLETERKFGEQTVPFKVRDSSKEFGSFNFREFLKNGRSYFYRYFLLYFLFAPLYHILLLAAMSSVGYCIYYGVNKGDQHSILIACAVGGMTCVVTATLCIFIHMADMMGHIYLLESESGVWNAFISGFRLAGENIGKLTGIVLTFFSITSVIAIIAFIIYLGVNLIGIIPLAVVVTMPVSIFLSMLQKFALIFASVASLGSYVSLYCNVTKKEYVHAA